MINVLLLHYALEHAGLPVVGVSSDGRIDYSRELTPEEMTLVAQIVAAHDPEGILPVERVSRSADLASATIPGWATWTEVEAAEWYDANVTDLVTAIPDIDGLTPTAFQNNAQAIVAQMQDIIAAQAVVTRNLARMVIALRNKTWPNLEGS